MYFARIPGCLSRNELDVAPFEKKKRRNIEETCNQAPNRTSSDAVKNGSRGVGPLMAEAPVRPVHACCLPPARGREGLFLAVKKSGHSVARFLFTEPLVAILGFPLSQLSLVEHFSGGWSPDVRYVRSSSFTKY